MDLKVVLANHIQMFFIFTSKGIPLFSLEVMYVFNMEIDSVRIFVAKKSVFFGSYQLLNTEFFINVVDLIKSFSNSD